MSEEQEEKKKVMVTDLSKIPVRVEKSHSLIEKCIIDMVAANYLPFYGEFALFLAFIEAPIGTLGVSVDSKGPKFFWDKKFVEEQTLESMNFLILHEIFHLLLDHVERSVGYDKRLANLAQDMIINTIIYEDVVLGEGNQDKVWMPKDEYGNNSGVFIPKEYPESDPTFEGLYHWLKNDYQKWKQKQQKQSQCPDCGGTGKKQDKKNGKGNNKGQNGKGQKPGNQGNGGQGKKDDTCPTCGGSGQCPGGGGSQQGQGQGQGGGQNDPNAQGDPNQGNGSGRDYGKHGRKIESPNGNMEPEMYSLEEVYKNLDQSKGMTMDAHLEGSEQVPKEVKREMVDRILTSIKNRGLMKGNNILETLRKLRKSEKDYLKEIKRSITNEIMSGKKAKSITRPHRRGVWGLKGKRKFKQKINAVLDTSGSMGGEFDKALSFIFQNDIAINLIQIDIEVQDVIEIKNKKELNSMSIKGLGGTTLTPALQYIASDKKLNKLNTVVLTDGYTDALDCGNLNGSVLIISSGSECPIHRSNGKVKQIVVQHNN